MNCCAIALAAFLSTTSVVACDPEAAVVERLIESTRAAWEVPGLAVAIVRGGDTLLLEGFGKRSEGKPEPMTPDCLFPLASCSKAFTTTLLAMLVDDGVLGWDDPVRKHLPSFKLSDPNADALVAVRDLVCHRTGLGGHDLLWYHAPWGIDEVLRRAAFLPLDYPFRAGYRYSTIPFMAAGRAIEYRTGEKWENLVRTRICKPLGMASAAFSTNEIPASAERAEGHKLGKNGKIEAMPRYEMLQPNPAGSAIASPRDVATWLKFHLSEGRTLDGTRIVSAKNLRETHTPQNIIRLEGSARAMNPETVQLSYAMAWLAYDYRGKKVLSHGGLIDGFRLQLTFLPDENLGFAVMANLHDTRLTAALTNSLIDLYCALPSKDWNRYYRKIEADGAAAKAAAAEAQNAMRNPDVKPSLSQARYWGDYVNPAYGTAKVCTESNRLVLNWSSFKCPLENFKGDTFQIADGFFEDQLVEFTVAGGKAMALRFTGQDFKKK